MLFRSKKLQKRVTNGGLDRREFIKAASAMGLAAVAPALYSQAAHATPKRGGTYRVGLGGANTGDKYDPADNGDTFMTNINQGAARNNLVEIGPSGEWMPELAESVEASPDAKTWVVKLRQGVEFHSGKTFDADDVIASIEHHRGEKSVSDAKSVAESMGKIRKDGKNTVIFELDGGNADFPYLLSDYHILIGSADKSGKVDWESADGTGAYVLKSFEPGVRDRKSVV